jgi:DNA polymerase (family 10)
MAGQLPKLVDIGDIKADLHVHSNWSEGSASIWEMANKAMALGLDYIAITDHSKSLGIAHGLDEERLKKQIKKIEELNKLLDNFTILKGIECDIKSDGAMDLSNSVLRDLDFVIGSIHSAFRQDEKTMTKRVIRAIHNECINAIGHPTGRLIQKRRPFNLNLEKVFEAAAEQKVMMEINAYPERLDLNDINCRTAMEQGVSMCIGTDSHTPNQMNFISLGVSVARRGWLEANDIANSLSVKHFLKKIHRN